MSEEREKKSLEEILQGFELRARRDLKEVEEEKELFRERDYLGTKVYSYSKEVNEKVSLIRADITSLEIDAIVNAANRSLLGGGGIDGAIHKNAGPLLYKECTTLGGAETGQTKITRGYDLPSKFILHTVGPIGRNEEALEECYKSCLDLLKKHKIKTVAFCGVSTGIYGYPLYPASHVALRIIREWLEEPNNRKSVERIILCTFLAKELECYQKLMPYYFPPKDTTTTEVQAAYQKSFEAYDPTNESDDSDEERKPRKRENSFEEKSKDKTAKEENESNEEKEETKEEKETPKETKETKEKSEEEKIKKDKKEKKSKRTTTENLTE